MLEYFSFKKGKKAQADKSESEKEKAETETQKGKGKAQEQEPEPILSPEDELYLERIISAEGTPPPLPTRPVMNPEVGDAYGNWTKLPEEGSPIGIPVAQQNEIILREREASEGRKSHSSERKKSSSSEGRKSSSERRRRSKKGKGKEKEEEKPKKKSTFSFFTKKNKDGLEPKKDVSKSEAEQEADEITRALEGLDVSASNNRAFSLSSESQKLVKSFTQVLKDLINGVPTAYDDLTSLLDDSQGTLARSYEHMPPFLKKLIHSLPHKLTSSLAPQMMAVAAEASADFMGVEKKDVSADPSGGMKGAAKMLISTIGLRELVTSPGSVPKLLKSIMSTLKTRFPAFIGTNVLMSLSLFILLFVFWYCHKRGREVRLEKEGNAMTVDDEGRIVDVEDGETIRGLPESSRATDVSGSDAERDRSGPSTKRKEKHSSRSVSNESDDNREESRHSTRKRDDRRRRRDDESESDSGREESRRSTRRREDRKKEDRERRRKDDASESDSDRGESRRSTKKRDHERRRKDDVSESESDGGESHQSTQKRVDHSSKRSDESRSGSGSGGRRRVHRS